MMLRRFVRAMMWILLGKISAALLSFCEVFAQLVAAAHPDLNNLGTRRWTVAYLLSQM
jgi:hypothetical protein